VFYFIHIFETLALKRPTSSLGIKKSHGGLGLKNKVVEAQPGCRVWPKTAAQHRLNVLGHYRDAISNCPAFQTQVFFPP